MSKEEASGAEREQALEMILKVLSTVGSREETKILKEQIEKVFPKDRILLFAVAKEWLTQEQQHARLQEMTDSLIEVMDKWRAEGIEPLQMQVMALGFIKKMLQTNQKSEEIQRYLDLQCMVEMGLDIRFGKEGQGLWSFIRRHVTDLDVLEEMVKALKRVETIDELRDIYE